MRCSPRTASAAAYVCHLHVKNNHKHQQQTALRALAASPAVMKHVRRLTEPVPRCSSIGLIDSVSSMLMSVNTSRPLVVMSGAPAGFCSAISSPTCDQRCQHARERLTIREFEGTDTMCRHDIVSGSKIRGTRIPDRWLSVGLADAARAARVISATATNKKRKMKCEHNNKNTTLRIDSAEVQIKKEWLNGNVHSEPRILLHLLNG